VAAWLSGNDVAHVNEVALHQEKPVSTEMGDGFSSQCGSLSQFVISHPGQHSLAIPSWVDAMSTNQKALFGWGVKAGMVRVWVADKTV